MATYDEAGVDLSGADRHVSAIADVVKGTWSQAVVGGFGGFAAGVTVPDDFVDPVLMLSTDGVGTKLEIARQSDMWSGVGHDVVAMCVDDLAATGAQPIGFVDYLAVGQLAPDRDKMIVSSVAEACRMAECPLLGGETAEHPGIMDAGTVDLAGTALGVVERGRELKVSDVRPGDLIVGLASPNARSNGFSLVRRALGDEVLEHAEVLLQPSVIYSPSVAEAVAAGGVHSAAHITGGGIPANLPRALPDNLGAEVDTSSWETPEVFHLIAGHGVPRTEMFNVFNMGVGFVLIVDPDRVEQVQEAVELHRPNVIGRVVDRPGVILR